MFVVIKREFVAFDPNDSGLSYSRKRDPIAEKLLPEYNDLKISLLAIGQRSPLLVDRVYDEDFSLLKTVIRDGYRRWLAAQADELALSSINAIVTTWVLVTRPTLIAKTTILNVDPALLVLAPGFELGSDSLTLKKTPPTYPMASYLGVDVELVVYETCLFNYEARRTLWGQIDTHVLTHGVPEEVIHASREMSLDEMGNTVFSPMSVTSLENSLAIVSCLERSVLSVDVVVQTVDCIRHKGR